MAPAKTQQVEFNRLSLK